MSVTREAVLATLRSSGTWTTIPEVADRLGPGVDRRAVARVVGQLLAAGLVDRVDRVALRGDGHLACSRFFRAV